jgi:hypothetical protein
VFRAATTSAGSMPPPENIPDSSTSLEDHNAVMAEMKEIAEEVNAWVRTWFSYDSGSTMRGNMRKMDGAKARRIHNEGGKLSMRLCDVIELPYFTMGMDTRFRALFKFTELNMLLTSCLAALDVVMDNYLEDELLSYNHLGECSIQLA